MLDSPRHKNLLAAVFILYGAAHLLAVSFVWLIVLALAREGYTRVLFDPAPLALACVSSLAVLPPLAGYALLRRRRWARRAVWLSCSAILIVGSSVVYKILQTGASANRISFVVIYGGAGLGLCLYGAWVLKRCQDSGSTPN